MTRKTISKTPKSKGSAAADPTPKVIADQSATNLNWNEEALTPSASIDDMNMSSEPVEPVMVSENLPEVTTEAAPFDPADLVGQPPVDAAPVSARPVSDVSSLFVSPQPVAVPTQNRYERPEPRPMNRMGNRMGGMNRMNDRMGNRMGGMNRMNDRMGNRMGGMNRMNNRMNDRQMDDFNPDQFDNDAPTEIITGILDTSKDGHGVLRMNFGDSDRDAYISTSQIRRFKLLPGDVIAGPARKPKENERYWGLLQVDKINDMTPEEFLKKGRTTFKSMTPVYPNEQLKLEVGKEPLSLRIIDMVAPIGKGQRSLIVSPPKAGKTTLLKDIAMGLARNNPEVHLMAVLVGERPEEVTDIRRHIAAITNGKGETAASNFDELATDQCRTAELALERAKRLVEMGRDVVILLDSITRLARAYNLAMPTSGRTLSGGFDPAALFPPKKFFGAARNFETPGSLTIIGTALVDTGSRMDDLVYEEFKGTGNQEVHLDRHLAERRVWPSIDVQKSGTRRDDLLIDPITYQSIITLQRMLDMLNKEERTMTLIERMKRSNSNKDFLASLKEG